MALIRSWPCLHCARPGWPGRPGNFGQPAAGQGVTPNQVIGVTSYLPNDSTLEYEGSSTPDRVFSGLFTAICGHQAGNCN